jgi:Zn-dependent oligopeptidase
MSLAMSYPACFDFVGFSTATSITNAVKKAIDDARVQLAAATDLRGIDRALTVFYNTVMPVQFLRLVSTVDEIRTVATDSYAEIQRFELEVNRDERLFKIINESIIADADAEAKRAKQLYLLDFELKGGLKLNTESRSNLGKLKDRVVELCSSFQKNLADDASHILLTKNELDGLDESFVSSLEQKDGKYVVTIKYPHSGPVLRLANNPETRKKMWIAMSMKATKTNLHILPEIVLLRKQVALLLGFDSDASLALSNGQRMVESVEQATAFLDRMASVLKKKMEDEMVAMRNIKGETNVYPWDTSYLLNKRMKSEFDVDHELVKEYFPIENVLNGILYCYSTLLSVTFKRDVEAEKLVWHKDVQCFQMLDSKSGNFIARFYLDLHPRPGKYSHAACWWLTKKGQDPSSFPTVCMVTNFTEKTTGSQARPALLRFNEVETFFHEFGHVCHACLSNSGYQRLNWTWTAVEMDFLEVPSVCFEKFIFDKKILEILSKHYVTGQVLPEKLRQDLVKARNASDGMAWTRVISSAKLDFMIHSANPYPSDLWEKYEFDLRRKLIGIVCPVEFESIPAWCSFEHMSTAYNSGYYSYLWSEVVACSIFSLFEEKGDFLDPVLGMRLRKTILEPCASLPGKEMVRNFLGKDFDEEAFKRSIYSSL